MNVFIIIPSFNEAKVIKNTISKLLHFGYKIVVVDDCSTDDTEMVVRDLPVIYIRHEINLGQGASLQTGMTYAIRMGADFAVHFDADGQHNPHDIPMFLNFIKANPFDVILGSRFLKTEDKSSIPYRRKFLLRMAKIFNGVFTGLWLTDAHNGFRVMNKNALVQIELTENRMAHATEILQVIKEKKLRYTELPAHVTYTEYSISKGQNNLNAFNIVFDLLMKKLL